MSNSLRLSFLSLLFALAAASPGARAANVNTFVLGDHVLIPETPPCPSGDAPPLSDVTPLPILVLNADRLSGVQFRFFYDPNVLEIVDPAGTCLEHTEGRGSILSDSNSSAVVRYDYPPGQEGRLVFAIAQGPSVSGSGTLLTLYARIRPGVPPGAVSPLTFDSTSDTFRIASEGGRPAPHAVLNGSVTVGTAGDVDGDRVVDAGDAVRTLKFAVQLSVPTPDELRASDMNQDRQVDVDDTVMVLRKAIGLEP